ncbi:MAG: T9SS type A sorting domain-containing protein [Bacteroidales bacterium]
MKKRSLLFCTLFIFTFLAGNSLLAGHSGDVKKKTAANTGELTPEMYLHGLRANQNTQLVDPVGMINAAAQVSAMQSQRSTAAMEWTSLGPDNFGGKTTALLFDNRDASNKTIYAGSVGGGIWRSVNDGITWTSVSEQSLIVSCMVQAPNGDIYVGTGDGFSAQTYNGLVDMAYTTGFVGSGIYKSSDGESFTAIASTVPVANNNTADWAFVSKIAVNSNGTLFAATNTGLKYSSDGGASWLIVKDVENNELIDKATDVEFGSGGIVAAAVNGKCYISKTGSFDGFVNRSTGDSISLPFADVIRVEIAIAPSNDQILYASCSNSVGTHLGIYRSDDQGDNWSVILPATSSVNIYNARGNYNNTITVFPDNADKIFVGGLNLWMGKKVVENGYFAWDQRSSNFGGIFNPQYVHIGQQSLTFKPGNSSIFFAGTEGGIFKGTIAGDDITFETCNRNYISTQFYTVAPSGRENRVLGGAQDQGTIFISGEANTTKQGEELWFQGGFASSGHGGSCVVSTIQPEAIVMSALAGEMDRSEDLAFTLSTQFLGSNMTNTTAFRTPITLWESYEDHNSRDSVTFFAKKAYAGGSVLKVKSANNGQPFYFTLPSNISLGIGDSIRVKDIVATKLFIAIANRLWMTKEFLNFTKTPEWFELSNSTVGFSGVPQSMAYSSDANHVFVGMRNGKLFRVSNIALAYDYTRADVKSPQCIVSTKEIPLVIPGTSTPITQAITSVAIDPQNPNNVMITLGNYGNDYYVLMSNNALSANPSFVSKQGNLPKMPVYASIIEMNHSNVAVLGTEQGVFYCENLYESPNWQAGQGGMGNVPVFDLKQQLINKTSDTTQLINGIETTVIEYPGTNNFGIIYGASFGKGLFRCNQYRKAVGVEENPFITVNQGISVGIYPNPVVNSATLSFEIASSGSVQYSIYDLAGRLIQNVQLGDYRQGLNQATFNTGSLKAGTYVLKITSESKTGVIKFLVR